MVNGAAAQPLKATYGPVTFLAALANILMVELALWWFLPWFLLLVYVVPLLVIDLAVAAILKSRPRTWGQIGRGMLIGLISAPAALALFWAGSHACSSAGSRLSVEGFLGSTAECPLQRDWHRRNMEPQLVATGAMASGTRGRPAELFRRRL